MSNTIKSESSPEPWTFHIDRWPNGKLNGKPYVFAMNGTECYRHVAEVCVDPEASEEIQAMQEANGRLLASAPALLAALKDCADWLARSARTDDREMAEDARAAIAQAEGGDK